MDMTFAFVAFTARAERAHALKNDTRVFNTRRERCGQWMMNELYYWHPWLYQMITGSSLDPFYNDEIIPDFLSYVEKAWERHWRGPKN